MKYFVCIFLLALLTSCSYKPSFIQNRNVEYLSATSIAPLHIPPGIDSAKMQNLYPVSSNYYPGGRARVNLTPPGLYDNN